MYCSKYWCRIVSLVVLVSFLSSLASPAIAVSQEEKDKNKDEAGRVISNAVMVAMPVVTYVFSDAILNKLEVVNEFLNEDGVLEKVHKEAEEVVKNDSAGIEKVADKIAAYVVKNNPNITEELQEVYSDMCDQMKEYPIDKEKIDELQENMERVVENANVESSFEFREYLNKMQNLAVSFLKTLGFNQELLNINYLSGFFTKFLDGWEKKYSETYIKDISSDNPHTSAQGVSSLFLSFVRDVYVPLFGVSNPVSGNEAASILGKAIALEMYNYGDRSSYIERVKKATKYVEAKIVGRVVDKIIKLGRVGQLPSEVSFAYIPDFARMVIVGYYEFLVLSLLDDVCAVDGMIIEKLFAALPIEIFSSQATNIGAFGTAVCRLERRKIGMKAQRERFRVPESSYFCVSQLQENGSSCVICDGTRVYQQIDIKRPAGLLSLNNLGGFDLDDYNIGHRLLKSVSFIFRPFLSVVEPNVRGAVLNSKSNALILTNASIDKTGQVSLDFKNQVNDKSVKITQIDSNQGCALVGTLPVVIGPGMNHVFFFNGCCKNTSYAFPMRYIVGDDIKGKYLHGMIWFKVPSDSNPGSGCATAIVETAVSSRLPVVSQDFDVVSDVSDFIVIPSSNGLSVKHFGLADTIETLFAPKVQQAGLYSLLGESTLSLSSGFLI